MYTTVILASGIVCIFNQPSPLKVTEVRAVGPTNDRRTAR